MDITTRMLEGFGPLKKLVPAGVKGAARRALLARKLRRAVRRIAALVLLDDANRPEEQEALARWSKEYGVKVETRATSEGSYALVTI